MLQKTKSPDAIDINVGARVRMAREHSKMSQEVLGKAVGITFQQIQKYEKGMNRMGASRLVQIARVLNVSPAFLLAEYMPDAEATAGIETALRAENETLKSQLAEIRKLVAKA